MNTRLFRPALFLFAGSVFAAGLFAQTPVVPKVDFPAASPPGTLKQRVGLTDIEISYSRPGMKGRAIFGGLESWGEVWRVGANSATKVVFSTPVKLNGTAVPAGTYGLFALLGKDEWTVIINKVSDQWGAYQYDAKDDVARIKAVPAALAEPVETFTIDFNDIRDESATLNLTWEKTRVSLKLEVDVVSTLVPQIEAVMASDTPKKPYVPAAMFYLDHNLDLKKAAGWMDAAIAAQPDAFYYVYRKALVLEKMGDKDGAIATAKASLEGAAKAGGSIKDEYTRLNEALIARATGKAPAADQSATPAKPRVASTGGNSPHETFSTVFGDRHTGTRVTISYGRPYTKSPKTGEVRKIWGGLVAWGKADRLGADEATTLLTQQPLLIGGTTVPAGAYTLYIVPSETGVSKLGLGTNVGKWGVPVDETHDLARVDLKMDSLEKSVDQLTLAIVNDTATGGGLLKIMWENTQFSVPFTVKK